jgi:hypothetical protein
VSVSHDDEIAAIIREFTAAMSADVVRQAALLTQRLRIRAQPVDGSDRERLKLIPLGEAAKLAGLSKVRMRAVCTERLHGTPEGFGYKRGGRWHVVDDNTFRDWLRRRASV